MKNLTRDQILAAADIRIEEVKVPDWGGSVFVKGMSGAERDRFEASIIVQRGKTQSFNLNNVRAKLCSLTICNEQGDPVFTEQDVAALSAKSASALQTVFAVAQRLSGLGDDDVKELTEGIKSPFEGSASN